MLTIGCGLAFWIAGMDWFDAMNYSMTTTATGGFSIHNEALSYFKDASIDYIAIIFEFLAGINFTLLYLSIFKGRFRDLFRNSEFKLYISIVLLATASIMTILFTQMGYDWGFWLFSAITSKEPKRANSGRSGFFTCQPPVAY